MMMPAEMVAYDERSALPGARCARGRHVKGFRLLSTAFFVTVKPLKKNQEPTNRARRAFAQVRVVPSADTALPPPPSAKLLPGIAV